MLSKTLITLTLMGGLLFGLAISNVPVRSLADGNLEDRVAAMTGITRIIDADLQARADVRAVSIQTTFAHCCLVSGEAEIIIWQVGYADPLNSLIQGWHDSPVHWAVMADIRYARIGCAYTNIDTAWYGVCIFAVGDQPAPVKHQPDTAMDHG